MGNFYLRELAREDLRKIAETIEAERPKVARKFLDQAFHSMELLAENPYIGQKCQFRTPSTINIRKYLVKSGWPYLIFYIPLDVGEGIDVVRVLHCHQRYEKTLNLEI